MPDIPRFTGKLVTSGNRHFFFNTCTNTIEEISSMAAGLLVEKLNRQGGCDLDRSDPSSPDMRPVIKNPFTRKQAESLLSTELRLLILETTPACNLQCRYCIDSSAYNLKNNQGIGHEMDEATARKGIDYLVGHSSGQQMPLAVSFYGGEPLLRFPFVADTIAYAKSRKERSFVFSLTTNGTLLTEEQTDFFVRNGVQLLISIDGPQHIHDSNRRTPLGEGSFTRTMNAIEAIRCRYPRYFETLVKCSVVITPGIDLAETEDFFRELGVSLIVNGVDSYGLDPERFDLSGRLQGYTELFEKLKDNIRTNGLESFESSAYSSNLVRELFRPMMKRFTSSPPPARQMSLGQCIPGHSRLFLASDGTFYPCEKTAGHSVAAIGSVENGIDPDKTWDLVERFYAAASLQCDGCWMSGCCPACITHLCAGEQLCHDKLIHFCHSAKQWGEASLQIISACKPPQV
jgi:uncharacterized protein